MSIVHCYNALSCNFKSLYFFISLPLIPGGGVDGVEHLEDVQPQAVQLRDRGELQTEDLHGEQGQDRETQPESLLRAPLILPQDEQVRGVINLHL